MCHPFRLAKTIRIGRSLAALSLCASLGACLSGPPPVRYLLEPTNASSSSVPQAGRLESLGLATVVLPGYVRDSAITGRGEGRRLAIDEGAQWAEAPDVAVTRVLAESLRRHSGADVLIEPLPRGFDPQSRVEIVFDRLLGNRRGGVDIAGQIRLISGNGRKLDGVLPFRFGYRAPADGHDGFFSALAVGLDDAAKLIIDALDPPPA